LVTTTINFTSFKPGSVGKIDYRYGFVDNSINPIQTDQQTNTPTIPTQYLTNFETGQIQAASIDVATSAVSFNNPKNWQKDTIVFNDLGGGDYEIEHTYYLPGFARSEDINGNSLNYPILFNGDSSPKLVFELTTKEDEIATSNLEDSTIGNAQTFFNNGNLGYYGEFLNGGPQKYTRESFSWDNSENTLDYTQQTKGIAQIKTSVGNFTTGTRLSVRIQEINAIDDETKTLLENINEDRVQVLADGTPVSSTNVLNATATVNAGDNTLIDLEFEILPYQYQSNYMVVVAVSNDDLAINHENIIMTVDVATAGVDTSDWVLSAYPGSSIDTISLNPHYDMDIGNAFNNMVGTVEDRVLARWKFEDQSSDKVINKLKAVVKSRDGSQEFANYEVTPQQIENAGGTITMSRGFILATGDPRNSLSVVKTGNEYVFDFAFQLWETQTEVDDLIFSFIVTGQQTLQTQEVFTANKEWRTAILGYSINSNPSDYTNILGYNLSRNEGTQADPKYLWESTSYSDLASGTPLDSLGKNGTTKIDAVFAPDPTVLTTPPDIADIVGYMGIRPCGGGQFEYRSFTTYQSPESDSPFEDWDDSGNTTFLDKIIDGSDKIHIRANIDYDKLKLAYPDVDQFELSFRVDKVQEFIPTTTYVISGNSRVSGVDNINFDTTALNGANVTADLLELDDTEFDYDIDGTPSADANTFESDLSGIIGTQNARLTSNTSSYIDSGAIVTHGIPGGGSSTTEINFDFSGFADPINDIVVWFDREIQFSSATIGANLDNIGLSIRTANPSGDDWTVFTYDDIVTDLALINADIVTAFATFSKFAIHITAVSDDLTNNNITMPFDYTEPDTYQDKIVTWQDSGVTFPYNTCIQFESVGLIQRITITETVYQNLFDWAQTNPFSITMQYNNANSSSTGQLRLFQSAAATGLYFFNAGGPIICQFRSVLARFGVQFNAITTETDAYQWYTVTYDGSQTLNGFKAYVNGIEVPTTPAVTGVIGPADPTISNQYQIGHNASNTNIFKVRREYIHDRVLTPEEIRQTANDIDFVPSSGLVRSYNMQIVSPSFPGNPEVIYEEVNDQNFAIISNHSNNRVAF